MTSYRQATQTRHLLLHMCIVCLLCNRYTLCLADLSMNGAALLGVREVLDIEDLERTILLYKSEDEEGIVVKLGAAGGGPHGCKLRRSCVL